MKRMGLAGVVLAVVFLTVVGAAWGEATATICVPEASSKQVLSTNTKGECPTKTINKVAVKYKSEALPGPAELAKLDKLLPHVNYVESGVGGKPTIQFSGVNVQIVNGEGKTASVNGEGNLVIGYDENPSQHAQTGSHDLILGEEQTFTSFGGIDAGWDSTIGAPWATVTGGEFNKATGEYASVSGGDLNAASGEWAAISGGALNTASGSWASVSGGEKNVASAQVASVSGGEKNAAGGTWSSIGGGHENGATGRYSSVSGGKGSSAEGEDSSISGGAGNVTTSTGLYGWIGGGIDNRTSSEASSVSGGEENSASNGGASVQGGLKNKATGVVSSIFGGVELVASGSGEAKP
jgi:hypothetical protein